MPRDLTVLPAGTARRALRDERGVMTVESTMLIVCVLVAAVFAWQFLGDVIYRIINGD